MAVTQIQQGDPLQVPHAQRAESLIEIVWRSVERYPDREAIRWKADGSWQSRTYSELGEWVTRVSLGLADLGAKRGDRVVIISGSRPDWLAADLAALALGAVTCPIDPSEGSDHLRYILSRLRPRVVVVEGRREANAIGLLREEVPTIEHVIGIEPSGELPTLQQLAERPTLTDQSRSAWRNGWQQITRSEVATIVQTSGSTGRPKGVVLTHGNIVHNCEAAMQAIPLVVWLRPVSSDERVGEQRAVVCQFV
jgi:long-chain acyl-CoA synthetase